MVVKTKFTHDDFVEILSMYDLGVLIHCEAITHGTVQTNYTLQTTQGKFVFRYYENRAIESILFESQLLTYLAEREYPCPKQILNSQGAYVGAFYHKPYVMFKFIEGEHIEHPNTHHKQQLIQKAAELQILTNDFHSAYTQYRMNYDPDLCGSLARSESKRINTKNAERKYSWLDQELENLDLPPSLPKGICHCDFHFSNVLYQNGDFVALLDFDDANFTYLQFDLVGMLDYWAWPHSARIVDLVKARDIVQAYMKHRSLSQLEKRHLFDVYKLSIMFDCVWYFARGSADDFYEKRKIDALSDLGRNAFYSELFQ